MKCKSAQGGCIGEGVEDEGTSSFGVGDIHITAQVFRSCMGGETYLDQIQNRYKNKIYSRILSHGVKKKTRPHRLGVNQNIWWRSRPPKYLYRRMGR